MYDYAPTLVAVMPRASEKGCREGGPGVELARSRVRSKGRAMGWGGEGGLTLQSPGGRTAVDGTSSVEGWKSSIYSTNGTDGRVAGDE